MRDLWNPGLGFAQGIAAAAAMAPAAVPKKAVAGPKGKKKAQTFKIDCGKPVEDKIMDIASFEKFLNDRIKVDGKGRSAWQRSLHFSR